MSFLCLALTLMTAITTATLRGIVVDEAGDPVVGANVVLPGARLGAVTGEDGRFEIRSISAGEWRIRTAALGYATVTDTLIVGKPGTDPVRITLRADSLRVILPRQFPKGYSWSGRKLGRPTAHCDSMDDSPSALERTGHISTQEWPWVGGSSFDFQLPQVFRRPLNAVIGFDSEVGQWDHGDARVTYDLGDYTGETTSGQDFVRSTECLDGVPVELATYTPDEGSRYAVQLYVREIGLGIFGTTDDRKERDALLRGFRTIRFHEPRRRN